MTTRGEREEDKRMTNTRQGLRCQRAERRESGAVARVDWRVEFRVEN
jgi:hypothetical protein